MNRDNQADRTHGAEADLIALAAEAERGYDPDRITRAPGRSTHRSTSGGQCFPSGSTPTCTPP